MDVIFLHDNIFYVTFTLKRQNFSQNEENHMHFARSLSLSLYLKKPFIMMLFSLLILISINYCRLSKHEFKIHISPMSAHFHGMVILVFYFYSSVCMCGTLPFQTLKMVMILAKLK